MTNRETLQPISSEPIEPGKSKTPQYRKNIQKALVVFCYMSYTIYSFIKFQMDLKETHSYDLALSLVIGILLSIAYRIGNNDELKKVCEQLDLQNKIYENQVSSLTDRLSQVPPWVNTVEQQANEYDEREMDNTEDPQMTERQVFQYRIRIPKK